MIAITGVVKEVGDNEEGVPEALIHTDKGLMKFDALGRLGVKALADHLGREVAIIVDEKRAAVYSLTWMGAVR